MQNNYHFIGKKKAQNYVALCHNSSYWTFSFIMGLEPRDEFWAVRPKMVHLILLWSNFVNFH